MWICVHVWTDGSATLAAVMCAVVSAATDGAVYNPVAEIVPVVHDQTTAGLFALSTEAVNCTVPADGTVGFNGVTVTVTGGGGACTMTFAVADFVLSATLVAVTVTAVSELTAGAV
jgi:hypothetical protein